MSEVSRVLERVDAGETAAAAELLPLVYDELRKMAAAKMAQERADHTLQPTALVHEAFIRLWRPPSQTGPQSAWQPRSRNHFFAAAAEAMRRILIEAARRRRSDKRGGRLKRTELPEEITLADETDWEGLLSLDEALAKFEQEDPAAYRLVMLKYFGGLTMSEAAVAMEISERTAHRYWTYARAWLQREILGMDNHQ
ncbi:MAG: sigma-70 family RNA polymerase sigma factor [Planctomycetaceae bacterium]|nr:sigma-70 family RNA polymerase sigma factor [Planctomycetaceae bacterium]